MTTVTQTNQDIRKRISVSGIVQGVGFRPFVYNLACQHELKGFVRNVGGLVDIEVQGSAAKIDLFLRKLSRLNPPMSVIEDIQAVNIPVLDCAPEFEINKSGLEKTTQKAISPDMATCDDCLEELFDSTNRRYQYPFINCTNCGPRFTIIERLPYDRPHTTMSHFEMCESCLREYEDPKDRRFHAQPNACAKCGPRLIFQQTGQVGTEVYAGEALTHACRLLSNSGILAVKGLGGFHILCDAHDNDAVKILRQRKRRSEKPFAVMMADVEMVQKHCHLNSSELKLLTSPERPIVLLLKLKDSSLTNLNPGNAYLGVMLPYTPVHHLLIQSLKRPLVCTSGNISDEPIAIDNNDALETLSSIVDGFLLHNRSILSRYDDSVAAVVEGKTALVRRSRGFAPKAITLPFKTEKQILAVGAHLKNTFCLYKDSRAYLSQHIGDLENLETLEHMQTALARMKDLFEFTPEIIASDMHPDYLSTNYAAELHQALEIPLIQVQHHHAHIVSCMVENNLVDPVIGVAFDGLGYGTDSTFWGGEFLICSLSDFKRAAHLQPKQMPGGNLAIRHPWRMALSYLNTQSETASTFLNICRQKHGEQAVHFAQSQIKKNINSPLTSSMGRLFDAASAVLNIRHNASFEGQAAIELEKYGQDFLSSGTSLQNIVPYRYLLITDSSPYLIDTDELLPQLITDQLSGASTSEISYRFHLTVAKLIGDTCSAIRNTSDINQICLSGGVFQNRLLIDLSNKILQGLDFEIFRHGQVPANDGGLSLGQAVVAASQINSICMEIS
ncbi:MAG: carbamoyltransferase HypF [Candidatus Obscuribacterales bacterium]|nr:carbamoyltransferase HypF [Candidatus Obscuribacterales bacterium]